MRHAFSLSVAVLTLSHLVGAGGAPLASPEAQTDGRAVTLGPGSGQLIEVPGAISSDDWECWQNFDPEGDINGGCWYWALYGQGGYYCAFAEGFQGPAQVHGVRVYVTQDGQWSGETQDLYVWGAGIQGPGCVLAMMVDVPLYNVPYWPDIGVNEYEIEVTVGPRFYVGHVINMESYYCWYHTWNEGGPAGDPWTCVPPGVGTPGWGRVADVLFPECTTMGIGVYVSGAASVEELPRGDVCESWGRIKKLFAE